MTRAARAQTAGNGPDPSVWIVHFHAVRVFNEGADVAVPRTSCDENFPVRQQCGGVLCPTYLHPASHAPSLGGWVVQNGLAQKMPAVAATDNQDLATRQDRRCMIESRPAWVQGPRPARRIIQLCAIGRDIRTTPAPHD